MYIRSRLGAAVLVASVLLSSCGGGDTVGEAASERNKRPLNAATLAAGPALQATWTQLPNPNYAPPNGPYARAWTEMTWDSTLKEIVVFGGNGPTSYENDIWSYNFDTAHWTTIDPNVFCPGNTGFSKPNGTDDTAFKYDPVNNLYWVFGAASGYRCLSYAAPRTAGPGSNPSTIVDPALTDAGSSAYVGWRVRAGTIDVRVTAYEPASRTLTLESPLAASFGSGSTYQLYATTGAGVWYFDPVSRTWVGQDTPGGYTGPTPTGARIAPAVDFSTADAAFVLFAGWNSGSDRRVWKLDVITKLWSVLPVPSTGAPPHMRELLNSFVYDHVNDVFILFGGQCAYDPQCQDNTFNGNTWVYKLSTNTWTNMNPPASPPARVQHLMAFDAANGVVVIHGGVTTGGVINNDTWYYHYPSNTWAQVTPPNPPPARYLAQIAYDPVRGQTVIFGGQGATGIRADIWALKLVVATAAPSVQIMSPGNGTSFTMPAAITIAAAASDIGGSIAKVAFFAGTFKIGEATSEPHSIVWSSTAAGTFALTAVATDNDGNSTTSAPVSVTVTPGNQAATVSLTAPTSGSTLAAPANLTLTANAADSDGSIAKVEFYAGTTKLGETSTAPYALAWNNVPASTYALTAVATDNAGARTTSSPVTVTVTGVNQPPSISISSPSHGAVFTAPAAVTISASASDSDSDGSITKVEYFSGSTKLGQTLTAPHTLAWADVAAGTYSLTAVATDNLGATTTSAPIAVTVNASAGGQTVNLALASNSAVASASSRYSANHPASGVNDGVRHCRNLGAGGVWVDQTGNVYPDWVQINFNGTKIIDRIDVFTMPNNTATAGDPTPTSTFTLYGITRFDVQYWDGSAWATVPGGSVSGNNLVWRTFGFSPVSTDRIRVLVNGATAYGYSFVCELQAWEAN